MTGAWLMQHVVQHAGARALTRQVSNGGDAASGMPHARSQKPKDMLHDIKKVRNKQDKG